MLLAPRASNGAVRELSRPQRPLGDMKHPDAHPQEAELEPALEAAYREHFPAIVRYLRRRLGDDVAEDAASDVFLRALRAHYSGTPVSGPWLYGVAANVISERRRSERRRLRAIERVAAQTPPAAANEIDLALSPELIRALRRLNTGDRDALLLLAWGDLSYEQVAQALDIPIGTVRSRIARARAQVGLSLTRLDSGDHIPPQTARPSHARAR